MTTVDIAAQRAAREIRIHEELPDVVGVDAIDGRTTIERDQRLSFGFVSPRFGNALSAFRPTRPFTNAIPASPKRTEGTRASRPPAHIPVNGSPLPFPRRLVDRLFEQCSTGLVASNRLAREGQMDFAAIAAEPRCTSALAPFLLSIVTCAGRRLAWNRRARSSGRFLAYSRGSSA